MEEALKVLTALKEQMRGEAPITPWDEVEDGKVYHIPPIKSLSRRDILILSKNGDSVTYKRIDDTEKKEGNMARTSVYAKIMVKRRKY